jgi:hypothetical protein
VEFLNYNYHVHKEHLAEGILASSSRAASVIGLHVKNPEEMLYVVRRLVALGAWQ